jgi:hypothetical protein
MTWKNKITVGGRAESADVLPQPEQADKIQKAGGAFEARHAFCLPFRKFREIRVLVLNNGRTGRVAAAPEQ